MNRYYFENSRNAVQTADIEIKPGRERQHKKTTAFLKRGQSVRFTSAPTCSRRMVAREAFHVEILTARPTKHLDATSSEPWLEWQPVDSGDFVHRRRHSTHDLFFSLRWFKLFFRAMKCFVQSMCFRPPVLHQPGEAEEGRGPWPE